MQEIIIGAAGGVLGDKATDAISKKPHLEEHGECLHRDIHEIKHAIKSISQIAQNTAIDGPIRQAFQLQPGNFTPMRLYDRFYNVVLVPVSVLVEFHVPGLPAVQLMLSPGWNLLNMPESTEWGLPSNASGNVSVLYCATNTAFGSAI